MYRDINFYRNRGFRALIEDAVYVAEYREYARYLAACGYTDLEATDFYPDAPDRETDITRLLAAHPEIREPLNLAVRVCRRHNANYVYNWFAYYIRNIAC